MNKKYNFKNGFSLIELVFVIVVLGIVASMSADTIAQVFKNTIPQKASNLATIKSELALEQISNRLSYAVPWSVVYKKTDNTEMKQLGDADENDNVNRVIEWVAVDGDSFEAKETPGWSGYCDIEDPSATVTNCPTPGSNLADTDSIIKNLGGEGVSDAIVVFKTEKCDPRWTPYASNTIGIDSQNYNTTCAFSIAGSTGANLTMANKDKIIADMYSIAWSAYALVPINERDINGDKKNDVFDLELRYGYQPWKGENFNTAGIGRQVIANNVSVLRAAQNTVSKNDIRIKICIKQPIGGDTTDFISVCKEKAIIK